MITTAPPYTPGDSFLRRSTGVLTQELLLSSGGLGLGKIPDRLKPDATTTMVCGYCSTGCGLNIHLKGGVAVNLTPTTEYPVNLGMACPKGWEALTPLSAADRATLPLLRGSSGRMEEVDWHTAMTAFTERFKKIQAEHGAESVAWLGTGQICTEELAFLGAFAKFGMGLVHGDGNTRQCMATSVVAYKESFGFDAPPFTYQDFEESDVIVLIGSNLAIAHPILWQRVLRNPHHPEILVIDPRKTETAVAATQHYAILPKSDLVLLYGVAHLLIQNGWIDRSFIDSHTTGFDEFKEHVRAFTPDRVSAESGITVGHLYRMAETLHRGKRVSLWWTMGVNQGHEAVRTAQAIINLALMTGNIGRPGTGPNSITGQCNAMGSRLYSNTTNLMGGYDFLNPEHRNRVAKLLNIPVDRIPTKNSLAYDQIIDGIHAGTIKGLWLIATNSAHSWISQKSFAEAARKLDFLVVQDMYHTTESAELAHLVLPAAGWGEKEGTFINSERRIGLVKKVARAPGQALSDFNIVKLATRYWGCDALFQEWDSPESTFQILKRLSRGQPSDITGIRDYRMIDDAGGIQWPLPEVEPESIQFQMSANEPEPASAHLLGAGNSLHQNLPSEGESGGEVVFSSTPNSETRPSPAKKLPHQQRRLFEDGQFYHVDGRARFRYETPRPAPDLTDHDFPFLLMTGRGTSAQWHTQTRTGKSEVLLKLHPKNVYIELNPTDAKRLGIQPNAQVLIISRVGRIQATAFVTSTLQIGQVFIPMHYRETNQLTHPAFDPYSRQPSYKCCAVRLEAVTEQ